MFLNVQQGCRYLLGKCPLCQGRVILGGEGKPPYLCEHLFKKALRIHCGLEPFLEEKNKKEKIICAQVKNY
ncbi:hypothetical protein CW304_21515 [Bacillus sp. UFRGS-B20]|nr:hypothetical protein CW304_21515 [Bacillus sp. UFRGS-B20]